MIRWLIFPLFCFLALCSACKTHNFQKLSVGMTKREVLDLLGKPVAQETKGNLEYWAYNPKDTKTYSITPTQAYARGIVRRENADLHPPGPDGLYQVERSQYYAYSVVLSDDRVIAHGTAHELQPWWYGGKNSPAKRPNISIASLRRTFVNKDGKTEFILTVVYALSPDLKEARIETGVSVKGSRGNFALVDVDRPLGQVDISVMVSKAEIDRGDRTEVFAILRKRTSKNQGLGNTLAEFWQTTAD